MFPSQFLSKLKNISKEELIAIKGVGDVLADNLIEFCESEEYSVLRTKFEKLEIQGKGLDIVVKDKNVINTGELAGEIICITGTFDIPRPAIRQLLENKGAKVIDSITKVTTILLAGESAGSKLDKAHKLGVRIVERLDELV